MSGERGVTLLETLIAIGIITMGLTMVGGPLFGALATDDEWREDVNATAAWRRAGAFVARDGANAETTSLADGAAPVGAATLSWTDSAAAPHTAGYALSNAMLIRTLDGAPLVVARRVVDAGFSRSGDLMTFTIEVDSGGGSTETATASVLLRSLP